MTFSKCFSISWCIILNINIYRFIMLIYMILKLLLSCLIRDVQNKPLNRPRKRVSGEWIKDNDYRYVTCCMSIY
ncbi:conserved hypothetical protein [Xenorhabdus bovienii str. kraussei Becker Underwood]|uniref:Uncharacterized protein n=1 Tax=Xenorhabdus bovienii str. kraussei Becker Underwood TaxID=1398204 RepID=A0A077PVV0_XENBV|nr:conserved hypothetical protein [Xenorhabdus bovienii str. kraussei Becker Underwood]